MNDIKNKVHPQIMEFIRHHAMDDLSRTEEDLQLSECIAQRAQPGNKEVKQNMTQRSIADFKQEGDSVSLAKLKGASFTIVAVEESDYEDNGKINPGVKILTQESYDIDGKKYRKFHTTRTAIVNKLKNPQVRAALLNGDTIGPVKTMEVPAKKGGKPYYDLVPASAQGAQ